LRTTSPYAVIVTTRPTPRADTYAIACQSEREARATLREEVKWESTRYVHGPALAIMEPGDFA